MEVRVILAEKPSMGATIASALGLTIHGKGYLEGIDPQGRKTICTWAIGHLLETAEPEDYDPTWKAWDWSALPMIPSTWKYKVVPKTRDQFDIIKAQLARATEVVVATDAGREGELIASLILDKAKCKLPALRLWTKSLTDEAIHEAYRNMKPWSAYQGLRDAAYGRSMADWLVGMTGSRAMTLRARDLGRMERGAWPIGRVMTPSLALLVDRELEIRNFVAKDFFVLEATFTHPVGTYGGKWFRGEQNRFEKPEDAQVLLADLKDRPARVATIETKEVRKRPEPFYDLTAIQKEANKRFGFSAEKTLCLAQDLYEMKVMSYPRTGSRHLTVADAAKIPTWLKTLKQLAPYAPFVDEIKSTTLDQRFVNDAEVEDHTALMPTEKAPDLGSLSEDQRRIYDLVARRFIAAFFPDRIEARTLLVTEILGAKGPATFRTTGTTMLDLGWSRVDAPAQGKSKKRGKKGEEEEGEDEKPLSLSGALLKVGDGVAVQDLGAAAKKTQPPKRMSEADLLTAMQSAGKDLDEEELRTAMKECSGIGTPATRAAIIEKLLDKGSAKYPKTPLVERQKNVLVPTEKGIDLIQLLPFPDLRSAELTGRWETQLEQVKKGKDSLPTFIKRIEQYTRDMTQALRMEGTTPTLYGESIMMTPTTTRFQPKTLNEPCPTCGGKVDLKHYEGRFYTRCQGKGGAKCFFGYDCDAEGRPSAPCPECNGRLCTTPKGRVCADCGTWENMRRGGSGPYREKEVSVLPNAVCPYCKKPLRKVKTRKGTWIYRCEPCGKWIEAKSA